jgi:hypothetical protein
MTSQDSAKAVCPHCFNTVELVQDFCIKCGAPLSTIATAGPYEQVLSAGFAYRAASDHPQKRIVLVGMWLLFGPNLICLVAVELYALFHVTDIITSIKDFDTALAFFAEVIFVAFWTYVSVKLLYKTTRNYRRRAQIRVDEA